MTNDEIADLMADREELFDMAVRLGERAEAAEAQVAAILAALDECDEYPGEQSCITAGPEVLAVEGCQSCRVRAALASSEVQP